MRKSPVTTKAPAEQVVKDIRRATRKLLSSEEKIRIWCPAFAARTALLSCAARKVLPKACIMVLSFVDGSFFAGVFLTDGNRCRLRSFVRPVGAVHVTAGLEEVHVPGCNQTNELGCPSFRTPSQDARNPRNSRKNWHAQHAPHRAD